MIIIIASLILLINSFDPVDEDAIVPFFLSLFFFWNTPEFIFFGWVILEIEIRK